RRGDQVVALTGHAARDRSVDRVEDLLPPGVDHGGDQPAGMADAVRERVERGEAEDRNHQHLGERLRGLDPDPKAGEETRPGADRDAADVRELDPGPPEEALDRGREHLLMAPSGGDRDGAEDLRLRSERHGALRRRGLDPEDDHATSFPRRFGPITEPPPPTARGPTRAAPSAPSTSDPPRRR